MNELAALIRAILDFPRPGALVGRLGGELAGASVVIEVDALQGRARWPGSQPLHNLLHC